MQNVPFLLAQHLAHEDNAALLPRLLPALGAPARRLLRALSTAFFRPHWYTARARMR